MLGSLQTARSPPPAPRVGHVCRPLSWYSLVLQCLPCVGLSPGTCLSSSTCCVQVSLLVLTHPPVPAVCRPVSWYSLVLQYLLCAGLYPGTHLSSSACHVQACLLVFTCPPVPAVCRPISWYSLVLQYLLCAGLYILVLTCPPVPAVCRPVSWFSLVLPYLPCAGRSPGTHLSSSTCHVQACILVFTHPPVSIGAHSSSRCKLSSAMFCIKRCQARP